MSALRILLDAARETMSVSPLSRHEAYVDRIKKEFNLHDYHEARALYESSPAYWEQLYGDDPLTSRNSPPNSLVPHQPLGDPNYSFFNPAPMDGNSSGPFGSGGRFVRGASPSSRPPDGSLSPRTDNIQPPRRLVRVGGTSGVTAFDAGAPVAPFASGSPIPPSGRPATFDERFWASTPAASASPGATAADDLEAFRRHWIKAFLEP